MPDKTNTDFFDGASEVNAINLKALVEKMMMHDTETRADAKVAMTGISAQAATGLAALFADSMEKNDILHNLSVQALQNDISTANMIGKQAVRHGDIAIDRQWNLDEQGYQVADVLNDSKFQDAIASMMVKFMADKDAS